MQPEPQQPEPQPQNAAQNVAQNRPPSTSSNTQSPLTPASQPQSQSTGVDSATSATGAVAQSVAGVVSVDQAKLCLRRVKDPDLQINIMDLGLVYGIRVDGPVVTVDLTLTSPGCPSGGEIMGDAEHELLTLPGVEDVKINLVWAPFWTPDKMEPRVRAYLGI